jgi:hypothetical protein
MEITWKVKWTSNCIYELTFDNSKNSDGFFQKGDRDCSYNRIYRQRLLFLQAVFYSSKYPEGKEMPPADMCLKKTNHFFPTLESSAHTYHPTELNVILLSCRKTIDKYREIRTDSQRL